MTFQFNPIVELKFVYDFRHHRPVHQPSLRPGRWLQTIRNLPILNDSPILTTRLLIIEKLYRHKRQMQLVETVQHSIKCILISQRSDKCCHWIDVSGSLVVDNHAVETLRPALIEIPLYTDAIRSCRIIVEFFACSRRRHLSETPQFSKHTLVLSLANKPTTNMLVLV
jgi:hypothetical protein